MDGRILTCVYCGHEYPQGTPAAGSDVLTEHIKVCERHPMRKAEADIAMLRAALVGLIGADSEQELRQMEATMRLLPAPDADKAVSINAIHALLATMTPNVELTGAARLYRADRTRNACDQLTRYGGAVFNNEVADVLDALTDINDDLWHGRDPNLICKQVDKAKALLDAVSTMLKTPNA